MSIAGSIAGSVAAVAVVAAVVAAAVVVVAVVIVPFLLLCSYYFALALARGLCVRSKVHHAVSSAEENRIQ
jgi:hypothetical protein